MTTSAAPWNVLPHGPLEKLAENLRWVQGSLSGMTLKRAMTVAKLPDGRLVIHNAIALDDAAMRELEAWGTPAFMLVPSGIHRLDAPAYKARYPQLKVLAPAGSVTKVAEKLAVDGKYEAFADVDPSQSVQLEMLDGVAGVEGVMIVRSSDGVSLVLNDAMFNMDKKQDLLGYLFTTALGSAPGPRVSRLAKLMLVKDKPALRAHFERLAKTPGLTRVIVAHEKIAHGPEAAAALLTACTYL